MLSCEEDRLSSVKNDVQSLGGWRVEGERNTLPTVDHFIVAWQPVGFTWYVCLSMFVSGEEREVSVIYLFILNQF